MLESQCCSVGFQESGTGGVGDGMCGGGGAGAVLPRAVGGGGGLCCNVDGGGVTGSAVGRGGGGGGGNSGCEVGACGGGVCCDGGVYGGVTYGLEWWTWWSEWSIGACGAVGMVSGGGRGSCGVRVGKLLMMLLHQIMIPVVLLPLRVHGGWAKYHWIVGEEHRLLI